MRWSWKIGNLAGIAVYIHVTFLLLVVWYAYRQYQVDSSPAAVIGSLVFLGIVFFIVVLHELGHALTARRYGIATSRIVLLPIGGVAQLEKMPENPVQEFWVAIAGPAVNIVLALLFLLPLFLFSGFDGLTTEALLNGDFLPSMIFLNILLAVFNLLPAFPMDGGRVLRALLAMKIDYLKATEIASAIGRAMALLFAAYGLFIDNNFLLVLIALFVWIEARREASAVRMRQHLKTATVADVMEENFFVVAPNQTINSVLSYQGTLSREVLPVMDDQKIVGMVATRSLLQLQAQGRDDIIVESIMQREFNVVAVDEKLNDVFSKFKGINTPLLPVVRDGQLIGVITPAAINRFLSSL